MPLKIKILSEAVIDPWMEALDSNVWDLSETPPVLQQDVEEKIYDLLADSSFADKITGIYIVGSICTKHYLPESDIDVTVYINGDNDELTDARKEVVENLNEKEYAGSHPINFYVRNDNLEDLMDDYDGIYDVKNKMWVKVPPNDVDPMPVLTGAREQAEDIAKDLDEEIGEIKRNIMDAFVYIEAESLKAPNAYIKDRLKEKIEEIEEDMHRYIEKLDDIHRKRAEEFSRRLEKDDLEIVKKYKSRNYLPMALIYKYLERWLYYKIYKLFKKYLKDGKIDKKEVKELKEKINGTIL